MNKNIYSIKQNNNSQNEEWKSIWSIVRSGEQKLGDILVNDDLRIRLLFVVIFLLFATISAGMTILNVKTGWGALTISTAVFTVVNIANVIFCLCNGTLEKVSHALFGVEFLVLFGFFAIVGQPEGFSIIWAALLPTCGFLLYKIKTGTVLSLSEWVILMVLFRTAWGRSLLHYGYTESFLQRFPILYLAFFFVGWFFEYIRQKTQDKLVESRKEYEFLYNHDALTKLYNRYGFNEMMDELQREGDNRELAFSICDIDDFKHLNDTYGHQNGDVVLSSVASIIADTIGDKGVACRWGGEEFALMFYDVDSVESICDAMLKNVEAHEYVFDGRKCKSTISIGVIKFNAEKLSNIPSIITAADENLYTSKTNGKNRATITNLE